MQCQELHGGDGASKIDWSMALCDWMVLEYGMDDPSLDVVNMSVSMLVVIRLRSGEHAVAVVYHLIRQWSTTLNLNVGTTF